MRNRFAIACPLATAILVAACSTAPPSDPPPEAPTSALPSVSVMPTADLLSARTEAEIDVPGGPDLPISAFESVWVLTPDGDVPSVTRIDPETNAVIATIPTESRLCQALGATNEAIWVCTADGVAPIDPATNEVGPTVEFDLATTMFFGYLPAGDGSLWALGGEAVERNQVVRIDPVEKAVTETFDLDFDASWITYGADNVWLTDTAGGRLWRLDPSSGEVVEHVSGLPGPGPSAYGADSIWLAVRSSPDDRPTPTDVTLVRISPESAEIRAELVVGGSVGEVGLHAADDAVWVRAMDPFLAQIDPATNDVVERLVAQRLGGSVTVAYDSVWATSYRLNSVWRIAPE